MHVLSIFLSLEAAHVVSFSIIEGPPIIIDRGMRPISCSSREIVPETPNRALV